MSMGTPGYSAARESAAWADLSARGRLKISGEDRIRFLHGQCTNDILGLKTGEGCYAACLTSKGKMRGDFVALIFDDHILLDMELQLSGPLATSLQHYVIADDVNVEDVSERTGMLTLCGPSAPELLRSIGLHCELPTAEYSHVVVTGSGGFPAAGGDDAAAGTPPLPVIVRSWRTGCRDFDIIGRRETIAEIKNRLTSLAPELAGEEFDLLRIEAGIPRFGVDMDENTIPNEAGLEARAISYTKGCYIGQETISRIKSLGHVNRHLVGLKLAAPISPGEKLLADGKEIGYITSPAISPRLGAIALGYVRRGFEPPGTIVAVAGEKATVKALPFEP